MATHFTCGDSMRSRSARSSASVCGLTCHMRTTAPAVWSRIQPPMLASWSELVTMISSPSLMPGSRACVSLNISDVVDPPITTSSSCGALISSATERRAASTLAPASCDCA